MRKKNFPELIKLVLKTPYFNCNPNAPAEIHSITSHSYLFMYIVAIKSFLRFYDDIAIAVHDDGSLENKDRALLEKHIRGIRIIEKKFADKKIAQVLRHFPNSKNYRATDIIAMQLFDYAFFSHTEKIISLDSDILFLERPNRLIEWIPNNKKEIVYLYEKTPHFQKKSLVRHGCGSPPHFCAGFFCSYKQIIDLEKVEKILAKMEYFGWFTTQNTLPILIAKRPKEYKVSFFRPDKYQSPLNFKNPAIFRHYWSSLYIRRKYIEDFLKVFIELNKIKIQ